MGKVVRPGRHIDPVTKQIRTFGHYVANIDTDTELDPALRRDVGIACRHAGLDLECGAECINNACELYQQAVAGSVGDATVIFGNLRIDEPGARRAFLPRPPP